MLCVFFNVVLVSGQEYIADTCFDYAIVPKSGSPAFNYVSKFWRNPTKATPDFFFSGNPSPYFKIPNNFIGNKYPIGTVAYVGIYSITKDIKHAGPNWREYISIKLNGKLTPGKLYCLSMMVSLADTCNYAADGLEAYFSKTKVKYPYTTNLPYEPQIKNIGGRIITEKKGWTKICSVYEAKGGEQYLTIGNFKDDQNTKLIQVKEKIRKSDLVAECAYYYIGMVSLKAISLESECDCSLNIVNEDSAVQFSQIHKEFVVNKAIILNNVYFNTDESEILPDSYPILDSLYAFLTNNTYRIEISGHTDSIGTEKRNLELSTARANAIRDYLVIKGIFPQRIIIYGFGSLKPVADNRTEEGRKMNRRVEIKIIE